MMQSIAAPLGIILSNPLALVALAFVPLIIILHSLNLKWRDIEVSSLVFWELVVKEKQTAIRLRRILRSLMLLAQIAAAVLLAVALSQPLLSRASLSGRGNIILVLDRTASMNTREGSRTRFDEAKARALEIVPALRRGSSMCVISAARSAQVLVPFTEDRQRLRLAIQGAEPTDEAGDMKEGVLFALSLRDAKRDDRIVIVTDGAFDTLGDLDDGKPWISMIRVGQSRKNAAVTALALRAAAGSGYEMFVNVRNYSPAAMSFPLTVTSGVEQVYKDTMTLDAGEERGFSMPYVPAKADGGAGSPSAETASGDAADVQNRIVAEIGAADDLAADNRSYAVLTSARATRALVVGTGNYFLENALGSLPNVSVRRAEPAAALVPPLVQPGDGSGGSQSEAPGAGKQGSALRRTEGGSETVLVSGGAPDLAQADAQGLAPALVTGADVVVFDGVEPPPLEQGNYILIGAVPPNLPLRAVGVLARPGVTAWNRASPLLKNIAPQSVSIEQALKVEAKGSTALLLSGEYPLILSYEREGLKVLFIGFLLDGSDFALRTAFPLLLANALDWFSPGWLTLQAEQSAAGEALELGSRTRSGPMVVLRPDGTREAVPSGEDPPVYRGTSKAGFYTVTASGITDYSFAVTPAGAEESDVSPRYSFAKNAAVENGSGDAAGTSFTPLWAALAVVALAFILFEWLLAVREKR
jgi:Ca-activated chloride channel homolog